MKNFILLCFVALAGCASLSQNARQALTVVIPHDVDFEELKFYAMRAQSAYDEPAQIKKDYPEIKRISTVPSVNVRYFIENDEASGAQTLSIRGTSETENVWQDLEISLVYDSVLASWLHAGFREDAIAVWKDAKPYINQNTELRVTGHSLGAAIALIVAGYAHKDEYNVTRMVNFGQPKITSTDLLPENLKITTRVMNHHDVVPMLPPPGFPPKYRHEGSEIILKPGSEYIYVDAHAADRISIADFWREFQSFSVEEHKMANYISNLDYKIAVGAKQVPYLQTSTAR